MSISTVVPVTISTAARTFIDRLGQHRELEAMIERAGQVVSGLRSIEVVLDEATEEIVAGVVIWAHRDDIGADSDPTHRDWIAWMATTFPPETCSNFTLLSVYHGDER
jgi:hypothetical protein